MLSTADFQASANKLAKAQQQEKARLAAKVEKERLAALRVKQRKQAIEEEKQRIRQEQLKAAAEAEERRAAELERNNGVLYHAELLAVPIGPEVAAVKGIKRALDKLQHHGLCKSLKGSMQSQQLLEVKHEVILPRSVESALMAQNAHLNGAMHFELTHQNGRTTCAAVLEFTGAEGAIGLPEKVVRCLWGPDAEPQSSCRGTISVRYKKLRKGTFARLQPRSALFQQEVGDSIKQVLERALHEYCVLSEGDWLHVRDLEGVQWDLRVKELQPQGQVSLIDTDLEAQLDPSVETEERIRAEEEAARRRLEAMEAVRLEQLAAAERQAAAQHAAEVHRAQQEAAAAEAALAVAKQREHKLAALPAEPQGGEPAVTCVVRLPDGTRCSRQFSPAVSLHTLYDFVESKGAGGLQPGSYCLVTQFPRNVYSLQEQGSRTLQQLGMDGGQVLLLLEPTKQ